LTPPNKTSVENVVFANELEEFDYIGHFDDRWNLSDDYYNKYATRFKFNPSMVLQVMHTDFIGNVLKR